MRSLIIDQGNSRTKLAWSEKGNLEVLPLADSLEAALEGLTHRPARVWLSSVADHKRTGKVSQAIDARWGLPVEQVSVPRYQRHLPTRYVAGQLGVDRWLAMLACVGLSQGPCLVVDAGTAITLDLVNAQGEHQGGYILPGLELSRQALLKGTAIAMPPREGAVQAGLATDTGAAISQGIQLSVLALIERLQAQSGGQTQVFLGGGDAARLSNALALPHRVLDSMVLRGLSRLASLETG